MIWLTSALISFLPISLDWHSAGAGGGGDGDSPSGVYIGGYLLDDPDLRVPIPFSRDWDTERKVSAIMYKFLIYQHLL